MNLDLPKLLDRARLSQLDFEQLVDIIIEQAGVIQQLQTTINELKQEIERLRVTGQTHLVNKTSSISTSPGSIALILAYYELVWLGCTLPDKQVER